MKKVTFTQKDAEDFDAFLDFIKNHKQDLDIKQARFSDIGNSIGKFFKFCSVIVSSERHQATIKDVNLLIKANNDLSVEALTAMAKIESNFISQRTSVALARRKASGLPLGRPKGSNNKALKLDPKAAEIDKLIKLKVSKASIAKIVGCHPQTLYDWLEKKS